MLVVRILLQICGVAKYSGERIINTIFRYQFKEKVNEISIDRFTESKKTF